LSFGKITFNVSYVDPEAINKLLVAYVVDVEEVIAHRKPFEPSCLENTD
jgi:hypothetical protein